MICSATLVVAISTNAAYTIVTTVAGGPGAGTLAAPFGLAVTPSGDLIVADRDHHQIKRVTPSGVVTVIAGSGDAGATDGAANTARFKAPVAVAYDTTRQIIYVADLRAGLLPLPLLDPSDAIRKIAPDGTVSTVLAAGLTDPNGLTIDADGNVYVADSGHNKIKKIAPDGNVTTIAGAGQTGSTDGPALQARFNQPNGLAIAADGALYIADQKNHVIRKLENGVVSTVAGNGSNGWVDGPALSSKFREPRGIAFDRDGALLVADSNNFVIRRVTLGAAATVTTVAGSGNAGYLDGSPSTAKFREPAGIAFAGAIYVADADNDAIRAINPLPAITSITPARGPLLGGNAVAFSGTGFVAGVTQVRFGSSSGTSVAVQSDITLSVSAPAGISGPVDVQVTTPGGTATLANGYTYVAPPAIGAVQPPKGATSGGTPVIIAGSGFAAGDTSVSFGSSAATSVSVNSTTEVGAVSPSGNAGFADVGVTTSGGSSSLHNGFHYFPPPLITSFTPASGGAGTAVLINGLEFDPDAAGDLVKLGVVPMSVNAASSTQLSVIVPAGATAGRISVTTAGGTAVSTTDFTTSAATLEITSPATAFGVGVSVPFNTVSVTSAGVGTDVTTETSWTSSDGSVVTIDDTGMATGHGAGTATITATYAGLSESRAVSVTSITAPLLDPPTAETTEVRSLADSIRFLYTGSGAVQTGVDPGTIDDARAGTIRGNVHDAAGHAVAGARITVIDHPEFGQTYSRTDGFFDLAVNGGGRLTLHYEKDGYLPAERTAAPAWLDQMEIADVVLVAFDRSVAAVTANAADVQIARGSLITDASGSRRATMVFAPATTITLVTPAGNISPDVVNVRATEYSVGAAGVNAMPAALPPQSGYTYCVNLSVDEALAAGATSVQFSNPVAVYVDNFLGFPAGMRVPVAFYDEQRSAWVPMPDGRVIRIISIEANAARVDTDGDGVADDTGIANAERQQLAALYAPGTSLWRVTTTHFTPLDLNWPVSLPSDATTPSGQPTYFAPAWDCNTSCGSIIEVENQTLGEVLPVSGTPFSLHYQSDRVPGRMASNTIDLHVSGSSVPASLLRIDVEVTVAGRITRTTLPAAPNEIFRFVWDGRDAYGRTMQGGTPVTIRTFYVYQGKYQAPAAAATSFGLASGRATAIASRLTLATSNTWRGFVGRWNATGQRLGGWTLSPHHFYDVATRTLYRGDGTFHTEPSSLGIPDGVVTTVAGNGTVDHNWSAAGQMALHSPIGTVGGLAVAPDGTLYISGDKYIHKITPDGRLVRVGGNGSGSISTVPPEAGMTLPALSTPFADPIGMAVGPDGSLYVAEPHWGQVRRITPDGLASRFAGSGSRSGDGPEGVAATSSTLLQPADVSMGPDGSVFIATHTGTVKRVGPDGIIHTVAGTGDLSTFGDGGPAVEAGIDSASYLKVGADGSIYILDVNGWRIRRVSPDGIITTYAGNGSVGGSGDGGLATAASICSDDADASALAIAPDDSLLVTDECSDRIRRIDAAGRIATIAGGSGAEASADGFPATATRLAPQSFEPTLAIATAPDGTIYYASSSAKIRKITPRTPARNGSAQEITVVDGAFVHIFNDGGRHLRTVDRETGNIVYQFGYDGGGLLSSITDADGNVTAIERNTAGDASAVIAPGGQRTEISGSPYATTITTAPGEITTFTYTPDGLMTRLEDARQNETTFDWNELGLLINDADPDGGSKTLSRTETADGHAMTVTTGEARVRNYTIETLGTGEGSRAATDAAGLTMTSLIGRNGVKTVHQPDGTTVTTRETPDPIWGMQAPFVSEAKAVWPSGRTLTIAGSRSVSLSDPNDPLTLAESTDTVTINGKTTTRVFDRASLSELITSPEERTTTRTWDTAGRLRHLVVTSNWSYIYVDPVIIDVTFDYDTRGRLTTVTEGPRQQSFVYNTRNEVTSLTDSLQRTTFFTYDQASRITKETLPDSREIAYTYDISGNLTSIGPPGRPLHVFEYSNRNLVNGYTPPAVVQGGATHYIYNKDRQLTTIQRPDATNVTMAYDPGGRLQSISWPGRALTYGYLATGTLGSITGADASMTYAYDGSLPTSVSWTGTVTGTVGWTYDSDVHVATESVNGASVSFAYDDDGFITNAAGMVRYVTDVRMTDSTEIGLTADYFLYNHFNEPTEYGAYDGPDTLLMFDYARDNAGRITGVTESHPVTNTASNAAYIYDSAGRLTDATTDDAAVHYTYDSNGNRASRQLTMSGSTTTEAATYDEQDRLVTYGSAQYSYTPNGELLSRTDANGATSYTYDPLGNLRHVTFPGGGEIDYVIDGQNRRVGKQVNGTLVQGFLYGDQLRIVAELDGNNAVVSRFVYASRANIPDLMIRDGVTYRIFSDHLGSPRIVADTASGTVMQTMQYDEFGNVIADSNPGFQPFGFAGGLYDRDTGLVRFGARDYDAHTGRWTAKDPIGFGGGQANLYAYTFDDPVNFIDPSGLDVTNNTPNIIFVKEEDTDEVHPVLPGQTWHGKQDGFAAPYGRPDQVYKTVDNIDATVTGARCDVRWYGGNVKDKFKQVGGGGWKTEEWLRSLQTQIPPDTGWNKLFLESVPSGSQSRRK